MVGSEVVLTEHGKNYPQPPTVPPPFIVASPRSLASLYGKRGMAVSLRFLNRAPVSVAKTAAANFVPVRQRTQFTCVAASTAMSLQALGVQDCDEDTVNRVLGAAPMKGASWEQVLATAQHYGVRATLTVPATLSQVKEWTDAGKPVMIGWNPEGREWSHASVIFDVQPCPIHGLMVYVADPNCPDPEQTVRVVPKSEFYSKWYEKFPNYLVRRPALMLEREVTPEGRQVMASRRSPVLVDAPAVVPVSVRLAVPKYQDYVQKKKDKGEKPLSEDEWERKVKSTGTSGKELEVSKAIKKFTGRDLEKMDDAGLTDAKGVLTRRIKMYDDPSTASLVAEEGTKEEHEKALATVNDLIKSRAEAKKQKSSQPKVEPPKKDEPHKDYAMRVVKQTFDLDQKEPKASNYEAAYTEMGQVLERKNLSDEGRAVIEKARKHVEWKMNELKGKEKGKKAALLPSESHRFYPEVPMSKQAKSPVPVVQKKNPNVMRGEAPAQRNPIVQGLIERGNAGAGKHKNKQDFDRGHARNPKHKGKGWGAEYMTLPVEEACGAEYMGGEACGAEYMQDHAAKFEEGVSVDPTKNMSEADAAEWKKQNAIHRSEFKTARVLSKGDSMRRLNELHKQHGGFTRAYFEAALQEVKAGVIAPAAVVGGGYKDGKAVAIKWLTDNMSKAKTARAFDPSDWPKALEDYVLHNPLSLGDRWDIVKMSHDEFKVEAVESVMYLHAKTYYVGEAVISVVGRTAQGKNFKKQLPLDNKAVPTLIGLLNRAKTASDKRPGPFIEITGKDGLYKVTRYQPTEPGPTRATTMVAWGEVQRVTKAGAPTGKGFAVQFHTGNKVGVDWKGNSRYLSAPYKEVSALPAKTAAVAGLLPSEAAHLRSAGLEDACWDGYEAVGMKEQGGKQVPNCVPTKTAAHRLDGVRGHQLLPATVARKLPAIYSQENVDDPIAQVKLFSPYSGAVWYLTEYDPSTKQAFGWADLGMGGGELGYIDLSELEGLNRRGLPLVERDLYWKPMPLSRAKHSRTASALHHAKFPKGEKMTVQEVAEVVGPEFAEMNENPPEAVLAIREQMAKQAQRKFRAPF